MVEGRLCDMMDFVNISDSELKDRDVWRNGERHLNELSTIITPELRRKISSVAVHLNDSVDECFV